MSLSTENWVFLGDSLTEGVGSLRISFVEELASHFREASQHNRIREQLRIHTVRLRQLEPHAISQFVRFNHGAYVNMAPPLAPGREVWLWNLGCEGTTIESDLARVSLIAALHPSLVVLFRGALENIIRPAECKSGGWPWWVPPSWRG